MGLSGQLLGKAGRPKECLPRARAQRRTCPSHQMDRGTSCLLRQVPRPGRWQHPVWPWRCPSGPGAASFCPPPQPGPAWGGIHALPRMPCANRLVPFWAAPTLSGTRYLHPQLRGTFFLFLPCPLPTSLRSREHRTAPLRAQPRRRFNPWRATTVYHDHHQHHRQRKRKNRDIST